MLVLTRREGERIRIGDDVWVTVLRTASGRVKIGIDAPRHVSVVRSECVGQDAQPAPAADVSLSDSTTSVAVSV